ncbi:Stk1 family PASTA domain-containing Ser/Thr kinase [Corynebacterium aquilae]|uniref:non-specific serine/threonine protein kinase n=1 Tax=Corynebacterium aquilae DSM 44791 TaxID=1431546 RepID=A0A1L7CD45_9CORY|nr:Stk1 family PASTA domain-containing Ser/Thr kinase [Corynebacterium aquilae]APT83761.1 serine/threonine protein kinase [Corynebacterium aquilae DSM 44791]
MILSDRYELGEVIGTGGMADVYAATDTLLGRGVAVKMMRAELARDTGFRERFRREGQNAGRLNHPNIVQVYDTGEVELHGVMVPYIVMERVHGRTLRDIVREDGPLKPSEAAKVLLPVCDALQTSHDAGIIHRDIKPANIMITNTGGVKVMDFGIARAVDDNTSAMTQTSAVIGTAQYLSPEQARGRTASPSSDVYALGCVFYEAITGRPPFEGESPFAVAFQHVHEEPTPPSSFIPGLTPQAAVNVDAVTLTAMAKHVGDRYQSAAQFGEDLGRISRNAVSQAAKVHLAQPKRDGADDAPTTVVPAVGAHRPPTAATRVDQPAPQQRPAQVPPQQPAYAPQQGYPQAMPASQQPLLEKRGGSGVGVWLASIFGIALLAGGGLFAYDYYKTSSPASSSSTTEANITVPDVSTLSAQAAEDNLRGLGLTVELKEQADPEVAKGMVISTSPAAGSQLPKGSQIIVLVSSGKEVTEVPDVRDKTTEAARKALQDAGLELDSTVKEQASDDVPKGKVIEQSPPPGTQASKGTKVVITVSTGKDMVRVPVITGMKWDNAEGNLTSLGFVPKVEMVDNDAPEGTVISIESEGQELPKGSDVRVEVSKGSQVTAPDLAGMTTTKALAALRAAGWVGADDDLRVEEEPTGGLINQGKIASQDPPAGSPLTKTDPVTVRVYVFDPLLFGER